ncbi:MAG: hypothetical protein GY820_18105 [Gammaproteobacteria bacterium]|nr:hypothetical protein [Gammaproteobacteria bacterium]
MTTSSTAEVLNMKDRRHQISQPQKLSRRERGYLQKQGSSFRGQEEESLENTKRETDDGPDPKGAR